MGKEARALDRTFTLELARVTEHAAIAAARHSSTRAPPSRTCAARMPCVVLFIVSFTHQT